MKKFLFTVSISLTISIAGNNCLAQNHSVSEGFVIGKPAYNKMIIDLWKDWDDNTFDKHDYMADTLVMYMPDGMVVKGKSANLEGAKKYRGSMTSSKSTIFACVSLNNPTRKEEAVCIWGEEVATFPDGKVEKKGIHEVWWFNKAGKIVAMRQWTGKFGE